MTTKGLFMTENQCSCCSSDPLGDHTTSNNEAESTVRLKKYEGRSMIRSQMNENATYIELGPTVFGDVGVKGDKLPQEVCGAASDADGEVDPALIGLVSSVGESGDEGYGEDPEDLLHPVAEQEGGRFYAGLDIVFAILASVDGII